MRIALSGATGFLGSYVLRELLARKLDVVLLVRDSGRLPSLPSSVEVLSHDLKCPKDGLFERLGRPDQLLHLAWGNLPHYQATTHFEVELPLHFDFLRRLVEEGLQKLQVTGTCLEYGGQAGELSECHAVDPHTPYGFAKDALRRQLEFLQKSYDFQLTWSRLFYMYGEGQSPRAIYSLLRAAAEAQQPSFPMSGGEQLRDFLPVERVAEILCDLCDCPRNVGIVNVCSGQPRSIRALVEMWMRDNDWDMELGLGHYPYPSYEPMAFWGARQKLSETLKGKRSTTK